MNQINNSINPVEEQLPAKPKYRLYVLIVLLFLSLIILSIVIYLNTKNNPKVVVNPVRTKNKITPTPIFLTVTPTSQPLISYADSTFVLENGFVYKITNQVKEILFNNVPSEITAVRLGPDNYTLHFVTTNEKLPQCADLNKKPSRQTNPPWDYMLIGQYNGIGSCETRNTGGFIPNTEFFVYYNNQLKEIIIEKLDDPHFKRIIPYSWVGSSNSDIKYFYPFPYHSYYLNNEQLFIRFEGAALMYDLSRDQILSQYIADSSEDCEKIANTNDNFIWKLNDQQEIYCVEYLYMGTFFENKNSLPLLVVGFHYENPPSYHTILDLSQNQTTLIDLDQYGNSYNNNFVNIDTLEWREDSIIVNLPDAELINDEEVERARTDYHLKTRTEEETKILNQSLEQSIMKRGGYLKVFCNLWDIGGYQGSPAGCYAVKEYKTYQYYPGGSFTRIK